MPTKQKFIEEWWDVKLVHENEKPKVWKEYAERLSDTLHVPVSYDDWEGNRIAVPSWESYFSPNPMKWVLKDNSYNTNLWCGTARIDSMFSVWNLVAFENFYYSDFNGSSNWSDLLSAEYLLQNEIDIKEFDNSYGKDGWVVCDYQKEVELKPIFFHETWWGSLWKKYFITGIFRDNKPRLDEELCKWVRIEEIRNNPWLYLHVYSIHPSEFKIIKNESNIVDAINSINVTRNKIKNKQFKLQEKINELELKSQEKREKLWVQFTNEWIECAKLYLIKKVIDESNSLLQEQEDIDTYWWFNTLLKNIDALNSSDAFAVANCTIRDKYYTHTDIKYILSDRDVLAAIDNGIYWRDTLQFEVYKIAKKTKTKNGIYCWSFFAGSVVDVFQDNDWKLTYRKNWANGEQVSYDITRYEIETGEEWKMKEYNDKYQEIKEQNKNKFDEFVSKVESLYGKDILNLVKNHKWKILAVLENLASDDLSKRLIDKKDLLKKALKISLNSYRDTVLTLISLIAYNPSSVQIKKVFWTEFDFSTSRAHYANILWLIPTYGKMDSIASAYRIYYTEFKDYADASKKRFDKIFLEKEFKSKGFDSIEAYNEYLQKVDENWTYVN